MFFLTPSSILVAGPSGSGKTVFVSKLFQNFSHYFQGYLSTFIIVMASGNPLLKPCKKWGLNSMKVYPNVKTWMPGLKKPKGGFLVMDDLMDEGGNDKKVLDLFTKDSHHRNITDIYLLQDLFPRGKYAKTISRNAHYIVVELRTHGIKQLFVSCSSKCFPRFGDRL